MLTKKNYSANLFYHWRVRRKDITVLALYLGEKWPNLFKEYLTKEYFWNMHI